MKKVSYTISAKADPALKSKIVEWKHLHGCDTPITGFIEIAENFAPAFENDLTARFNMQVTHLVGGTYTFHDVPISTISAILDANPMYVKYIQMAREKQWHNEN